LQNFGRQHRNMVRLRAWRQGTHGPLVPCEVTRRGALLSCPGHSKRSPCRGDGKETRGRGGGANRPSRTDSGEKQLGFTGSIGICSCRPASVSPSSVSETR